jgi:hypothetical protein
MSVSFVRVLTVLNATLLDHQSLQVLPKSERCTFALYNVDIPRSDEFELLPFSDILILGPDLKFEAFEHFLKSNTFCVIMLIQDWQDLEVSKRLLKSVPVKTVILWQEPAVEIPVEVESKHEFRKISVQVQDNMWQESLNCPENGEKVTTLWQHDNVIFSSKEQCPNKGTGKHFKVSGFGVQPNIIFNGKSISGVDFDILQIMSEKLNFSFSATWGRSFGSKNKTTGKFDGIAGMVNSSNIKVCDRCVNSYTT